MTDVHIKVKDEVTPKHFAWLIEEGCRLGAVRLMEEVFQVIELGAHQAPEKRKKSELPAYYADRRMPFWTGELLRSMKVETTADGARLHFAAEHASDVEEGTNRAEPLVGEMKDWAAYQGIKGREGTFIQVMHPHMFIWPVLEKIMESGRGMEIMGDAIVDVLRTHNIGK